MSYSTAARVMPRPSTRPQARTAPPPRLRVVAPRAGRSRAGLAVLCISMLVVGLITLLLLNISLSNGAYELTSLQKTQLQASEHQQALAEQVDLLSAPQQLAKRAKSLGMVAAPNTAFVRLSDGTIIGSAAKATAPPKPTTKADAVIQGAGGPAKPSTSTTKSKNKAGTKPGTRSTTKTTTKTTTTTATKQR